VTARIDDPIGAFVDHGPGRIAGANGGPLAGLTFAVKDLYDVEGFVTGGGSSDWLRTHGPAAHTATAVAKLLDAGADMIGKTVCDELFYSFSGANAHYGTPVNVRAPGRVPGGSSSGSAAAVAAGLCDFALGSDTGGSIRLPASFCGIYGLRPTHGRIDMTHTMSMAPSFDVGGWFADDAKVYRAIGAVLLDGNGDGTPVSRVLIADDAFDHAEPAIAKVLRDYLSRVSDALPGTESATIAPFGWQAARDCFSVLQAGETWRTYGAWIEANRPALGPGIEERYAWASTIGRDDIAAADATRTSIVATLLSRITPGTLVCLPTAATLPARLVASDDALESFRAGTVPLVCLSGLSGLPQFSIPAATHDGCPVGLSFMGWPGSDEALLDLAVSLAGFRGRDGAGQPPP
jgi:amidase